MEALCARVGSVCVVRETAHGVQDLARPQEDVGVAPLVLAQQHGRVHVVLLHLCVLPMGFTSDDTRSLKSLNTADVEDYQKFMDCNTTPTTCKMICTSFPVLL